MKSFAFGILAGCYLLGAAVTFVLVGFFAVMGGRSTDLWKPFVYAIIWPVFWLWTLLGQA